MLMRVPAMLYISTDDLHDKLQKFAIDLSVKADGYKQFAGGLSAAVSFGTAFATADFRDVGVSPTLLSYLFFGAACIASVFAVQGYQKIRHTKECTVETVFAAICRDRKISVNPDGTLGAEPLTGTGSEPKDLDKKTEWTDCGETQKNMRVYG